MSIVTRRGENRRTVGTVPGLGREREKWWGRRSNETQGETRREREEAWGRWLLRYGRHHHPSHPIVNSGAAVPNLSPCVLVRTVFYRCLLLQAGSNTDISALPAHCDALASVSRSPSRSSLVPFLLLRLSPSLFYPSGLSLSVSVRFLLPRCVGKTCMRRTRMKRIGGKGEGGGGGGGGGGGRRRTAYRFPHESLPRI